MKISIAQGHNPPHNINGITVIIDVIRAFTTSHEAFLGGASHIYLIMRTTNGVAATLRARDSRQVLVGALINAEATANYIREQNPDTVVLVASHPTGDEDVACAEYIRGLLGGEGISLEQARERTRNAFAAKKFLDGSHPRLRPQDIDMAASSAGPDALIMGVTYEPVPRIDVIRRAS